MNHKFGLGRYEQEAIYHKRLFGSTAASKVSYQGEGCDHELPEDEVECWNPKILTGTRHGGISVLTTQSYRSLKEDMPSLPYRERNLAKLGIQRASDPQTC